VVRLSADELVAEAQSATGIDDLGPPSYREGLQVLVEAAEAEAGLNDAGRGLLAAMIRMRLENRIHLYDWHRRQPEIGAQAVPRPVFVIGLWRTGTTIMSYLLAQDPERRSLLRWEAAEPSPPPGLDPDADQRRIDKVARQIELQHERTPELAAINIQEPTGPTECVLVLSHEFKSQLWDTSLHVPSYYRWNRATDQTSAYELHRATLQLLQWKRPPHEWHLKAPAHTLSLDALRSVYPDALYIVVHRDPAVSLASACDFWELQMTAFTDQVDAAAVGRHWLDVYDDALGDLVRFLDTADPTTVVELSYRELKDPITAIGRAYEHLGLPLSAEAEARMAAFLADHRPGRHGAHTYSLEHFGLDRAEVDERLRPHVERLGIEVAAP
jgi:hypothetical protein